MDKRSKGGKTTALINRKEALDSYYLNPKICLFCNKIIEIKENQKVSGVKVKKFCNSSCSTSYNNRLRNSSGIRAKREYVRKLRKNLIIDLTKGELFGKRNGYQSARASIRELAYNTYINSNSELSCKVCGYDKHIEVCHIRSVSLFSSEATLREINDISNLVALCPNHHWEFDHELLELGEYGR